MQRIAAIGIWALVAGCSCKGDDGGKGGDDTDDTDGAGDTDDTDRPGPPGGAEIRIDEGGALPADPHSAEVRLCGTVDGAVVVAWTDDRDGSLAVYARRSPDAGLTWPDPPVRFGVAGATAEHPDLVCDGGSAVLAWEDRRDGQGVNPNVYVAASPDGGATWSESVRVTADALGAHSHLSPRLAAAGGKVHVAWYGDEFGAYDVFVASSADGGVTFGPPARLGSDAPGSAWSAHPVVAADGSGEVHVAWEDRRTGVVDVYVASSDDDGTAFGGDRRIDDSDAADSYAPSLHVGFGLVHAAWHDRRDGEAYEVYVARSTDGGGTFAAPQRVSAGEPAGTFDAVLPRLAWSEGTLQVAWYGASGGGYHAMHRIVRDGVPSGAPVQLDDGPGPSKARYPRLAVSGADVVVAWEDDRDATAEDGGDLYYTSSADGGATFATADLRLDSRLPGGTIPTDLAIAIDHGVLLAAWSDTRDGTADVWFARRPLGEAVP